ncbi:MAG TPA: 50S ribosomal protein L2 [Candidatus Paceibacterota bacterium]|nr:50S ribosomal protein L2 [Candidatus Paceibacterota bacterium]
MKNYKPTSPGTRGRIGIEYSKVLTTSKPKKSLLGSFKKQAGRNKQGRITVRHQGGGHKQLYRIVDFRRDKIDIPAKVKTIEYDPNRSAFIALICYADGEKRYILASQEMKVGDEIITSEKTIIKPGNRMALKNIPVGTFVYNIELIPSQGGKIVRTAGSGAQVSAQEGRHVHLTLPSTEIRMVKADCMATIGALSNPEHIFTNMGKAGRMRWKGVRPRVRGTAMNPVDHPHGGGEGRTPIGLRRGPKTPWGKQAFGVKTRKTRKYSDTFIIKRRIHKKRK